MNISRVNLICFSPTSSTKKVVELIGSAWETQRYIDTTPYSAAEDEYTFSREELAVFGVPSFGGRVPDVALKRFSRMKGDNTPAVVVCAYGNRAYEDTLRELAACLTSRGFRVIAAVAAVCEHSIVRSIANGRPNAEDEEELKDFSRQIRELVKCAESAEGIATITFDTAPYREYGGVPMKPHADKKCNECGVCAQQCPTNSIPHDKPNKTAEATCITCMRCVYVCPQQARKLNKVMLFAVEKKLRKVCDTPKSNELFLG
ncbi:MAG: 4Fe-4S ferredoxin [Christensenella sp.]